MSRSLKIVHEVTKQDATMDYNFIPDDNTSWFDAIGDVTTSLGKIVPSSTLFGWNKGASFGSLPINTDGYVEFTPVYMAGQSSGGRANFGLTDLTTGGNYTDIDFSIFLENDGTVQIYESGSWKGYQSTWTLSDTFKVERVGTTVYYKKNGTIFYTSLNTNLNKLYFDCSLNRYLGAENLVIHYNAPCEEVLIPDYNTVWDNVQNCTTSVGGIVPITLAPAWGNKGGSFGTVPANTDCLLSFEFDFRSGTSTGSGVIGFSEIDVDKEWQTVDYGIYISTPAGERRIFIVESGTALDFGNGFWLSGDVMSIKRSGGVVSYYKNGVSFYTSSISSTSTLLCDYATNDNIGGKNIEFQYDTLCPIYTVTQTDEFDLLEDEYINIQKSGINIDALGDIEAGTTNSFTIPYTVNNNKIFDYLELVGTQSNFPYQDNFVKYTEDGIELITNGRLKVTELSNKGYEVDILHGVNDFFDKIRGKFLYEAYEPYRTTLQQMVASQTTLCNNTTVRDNEGYCVPLIDLAGINPIAEYQQTVGYYLKFGIEKIAEAIDYTVSYDNIDLEDYVFTHNELPTFDTRTNNFINDQIISPSRVILKDENIVTYTMTMRDTGVLYLNQILVMTSTASGYTTPPEYDFEILLNGTTSLYNNTITSMGTFTDTFTSATALPKGSVITFEISTGSFNATDGMTLDFYFYAGLYSTNGDVYHENILGDYSQTDFLKNIMQTFNIGVTVSAIAKTINFYNANDVFKITGAMNDLTRYYSETKSRSFDNDYGRNNIFKYKYLADDADFADGVLVANNTNEEKTIIDSELTASEAFTPMTLGQVNTKLITVKGYDSQTPNAKNNAIGYRISKVTRVNTTPSHPVTVDYENTSNVTTTYTSDQTFLNFGGLDWNTIINTRYNNLRDNVLNRYVKYTVLMNCPKHIINDYDFKEQVYIRDLGSRFAVSKISTLTNGMSEWELIKIN